jgi:hypothetical protein
MEVIESSAGGVIIMEPHCIADRYAAEARGDTGLTDHAGI